MSEVFARGLRSVERQDSVALVLLRADTADLAALPGLIEAAFPGRLSFTLSPTGEASVVLPEAELDAGLAAIPASMSIQVSPGLTVIRAAGVCMSAAENKARRICADLSRAGIRLHAFSLCDLAVSFTVDAADADRAFDLVCEAVPLVW